MSVSCFQCLFLSDSVLLLWFFLGKWCLDRAGLVYVLLRDTHTQQKWCSQLTLKEKQPICWDEWACVLIELCVSSVRTCTCSASNMTRCRSQTGTQRVEGCSCEFFMGGAEPLVSEIMIRIKVAPIHVVYFSESSGICLGLNPLCGHYSPVLLFCTNLQQN